MDLIKIENVRPEEKIDQLIREGRLEASDTFTAADVFSADITLTFAEGTLLFSGVPLENFARYLMNFAFQLNFYDVRFLQAEVVGGGVYILFTVNIDKDLFNITVELDGGLSLYLNGVEHKRGEAVNIRSTPLEFNRVVGSLFGKTLEILSEKFDNIDGVNEYFGAISYSEGFYQLWLDD